MLRRARGFAWRLRRVGTVNSLSGHGTALRNFFDPRLPGGGPDRRSFSATRCRRRQATSTFFRQRCSKRRTFLFQRDACGSDPQLRQGTDRLGRASLVVLPAQTTLPARPVFRSRPRRSSRANSTSRRSLRARQGPPMHERRAGIQHPRPARRWMADTREVDEFGALAKLSSGRKAPNSILGGKGFSSPVRESSGRRTVGEPPLVQSSTRARRTAVRRSGLVSEPDQAPPR